jgi:hypothetical protein
MMKNMIAKTIIAITLAAVGILSARTAEAATVTSGSYSTTSDFQIGDFSGPGFSVHLLTGGGVFFFAPGFIDFNSGMLPAGAPFDAVNLALPSTLTNDGVTCGPNQPIMTPCSLLMTFLFAPNLLPNSNCNLPPPNQPGCTVQNQPFTMVGDMVVGNLPPLLIEGSGTFNATRVGGPGTAGVTFTFVPEPSSLILMLIGLVGVSWSRWRFGKRAGSSRSTAAAD